MATMSPKPWYLNYNEFEFFRNKFNPDWGVEFNTQKFNNVINNTTDGQEKRKYNDIFKEIFRHINNKGVFISYDSSNACNYISYILFKEVEKKNNVEYNEDTFRLKLQPYYECPHRKYLLHKSKIEIEREKEQLEVEARARQQAASLKAQVEESGSKAIDEQERRTDTQEQQQQEERAHGHEALQEHQIDSVTIDHSNEAETRAASVVYRGPVHNPLSRQYGRLSHDELSIHNKVSGRYPEQGYYKERGHSYDSQLENKLGSAEERNLISGDPLSSASEERGFIHNVKDTLSGIIGDVDPIPVVGVSGGMGALFLLFRYTPVGTFFRGRGRVRRIPSGFSGPFPGDFANIQEYDGGFIGYSPMNMNPLAE
ncbi:PIR protein [Plasmodium vivax]|uniref:VIR protein n=1 Tax=Plasmodium vivax TaxID=5855 RepID=A0A565A5K8_PLAVI|nr:PIR protein [Plasmodium vivax]